LRALQLAQCAARIGAVAFDKRQQKDVYCGSAPFGYRREGAKLVIDDREQADVTPLGAGHLISEMKVFNEKAIATSSATGSRAGKVRAMDCAA
jgi:hypothetical protein